MFRRISFNNLNMSIHIFFAYFSFHTFLSLENIPNYRKWAFRNIVIKMKISASCHY